MQLENYWSNVMKHHPQSPRDVLGIKLLQEIN